jgi:mono/diheme cytochrome c family protein
MLSSAERSGNVLSLNGKTVKFLISSSILAGLIATGASAAPPKSAKGAKKPSAAVTAGKKVYAANKCDMCHKIAGKGGANAPDLSKEGANVKHSAAWLQVEIQNPKAHKPDSRMPAFKDKIAAADLANLVAYLRSLK